MKLMCIKFLSLHAFRSLVLLLVMYGIIIVKYLHITYSSYWIGLGFVVGWSHIVIRGTWDCRRNALRGEDIVMQDFEKTTENSEQLNRQARPGIEPGKIRLPVWAQNVQILETIVTKYKGFFNIKFNLCSFNLFLQIFNFLFDQYSSHVLKIIYIIHI